jgi:hypothetical protein
VRPSVGVRARSGADLAACVRGLADVHRTDGYPLNRPADPPSWLSPDGLRHARAAVPVGPRAQRSADGVTSGALASGRVAPRA